MSTKAEKLQEIHRQYRQENMVFTFRVLPVM